MRLGAFLGFASIASKLGLSRTRMGNGLATVQFFIYGRQECTQKGWEKAKRSYGSPDPLDLCDLSGRVMLVTGANSGIGFEIAQFAASRGARTYMLCRNAERAEAARAKIVSAAATRNCSADVHVLLGDTGLRTDMERCAAEFCSREKSLDALVCNAGVLLNERQETAEGYEVTFASHLLFGSYMLADRLEAKLTASSWERGARCVFVSSGGMYNRGWPSNWDVATSRTGSSAVDRYDGQMAYVHAKRGQVLLAERWARDGKGEGKVGWVSAHPGWVDTPAVDDAYGKQKKYLEPMRTPWQGAEGICWLACAAVAPAAKAFDDAPSGERIVPGGFYLDRSPRCKHIAGPFMSEGSATRNSEAEVDTFLANLRHATENRADVPPPSGKSS